MTMKTIKIDCELTLSANTDGPKKFSMVANTGQPMKVGFNHPAVLELSGLKFSKSRPILRDHNPQKPVGHTSNIRVEAGKLLVDGILSGANEDTSEIVNSSKNDFPWQASVGVSSLDVEFIAKGEKGRANNQSWDGPIYIVKSGKLDEISIVTLGADDDTSTKVAANLNQEKEEMAEINSVQAEKDRIEKIEAVCGEDFADIAAKAINENWTTDQAEIAVMRAKRPIVTGVRKDTAKNSPAVLSAALLLTSGVSPDFVAKHYGQQAVDQATSKEFRDEGIQSLCYRVINEAGMHCRVGSFNSDTLRTAFEADRKLRASGYSTISLPGILGDSANKSMLAAYEAVGGVAGSVCGKKSVKNFLEHNSYRMTGIGGLSKVGPGGEIKHIGLDEDEYTNQAETYGAMLTLTRQDIINDDLGAFNQRAQILGRMAAEALEDVFFTLLLDNTGNFYHSNNNNLSTSSALGTTGLANAVLKLQKQTDANGKPISLKGQTILCPVELGVTASQLMTATGLVGGSSTVLNSNVWAGQFGVQTSPRLSNTTFHASASTSSWYLFTNPAITPSFVISYLNGNSSPVIESSDTSFETLGVQMRAVFDFGVNQADPKGSVKATQ